MENMFWGGEMLKLESVALQEEKIIEWRETLRRAIHASLIPLKAYAEGTVVLSVGNESTGGSSSLPSSLRILRTIDEFEH